MLVAISLANGGPGFPWQMVVQGFPVCPRQFRTTSTMQVKYNPVIEDITDIKVKEHLSKVCFRNSIDMYTLL